MIPPLSPLTFYKEARAYLIEKGYGWEIDHVHNLPVFPAGGAEQFFEQYVWVVLNAGMKEQIARRTWERYFSNGLLDSDVIGHPGKRQAIIRASNEYPRWFRELTQSEEPIEYLETLPWIGPITKYHLARNIGIDAVKPDRHLVRIASYYGYATPWELCEVIQKGIPFHVALGEIDVIIWRYCNLTGGI